MKRVLYQLFIFLLFSSSITLAQQPEKLYVGTFTGGESEGIYLCNFDAETGKLTSGKTFKGIDNPNFLKISPDRKYLYVATRPPAEIEKSGGYINSYKINQNGELQFLNKQVSHGNDPCHVDISADGKFVAIATYGGGSVSLFPVKSDGKLLPASSTINFTGSGPNKARQNDPHAHSIKFSPAGNQAFSADLGTDQLNIFRLEHQKLIPASQKFVKTDPGAGPRHFDFHPDGKFIYVINELNSTITVFQNENEVWKKVQSVSTIPPGFSDDNYCADIHVSSNGKFLYGSNRGHNSISFFKIDAETKKLDLISIVPSEGKWPRNFTLTKNGKYMLVANQNSNNITVFKINQETGTPVFTGNELKIPAPVCLGFLNY